MWWKSWHGINMHRYSTMFVLRISCLHKYNHALERNNNKAVNGEHWCVLISNYCQPMQNTWQTQSLQICSYLLYALMSLSTKILFGYTDSPTRLKLSSSSIHASSSLFHVKGISIRWIAIEFVIDAGFIFDQNSYKILNGSRCHDTEFSAIILPLLITSNESVIGENGEQNRRGMSYQIKRKWIYSMRGANG